MQKFKYVYSLLCQAIWQPFQIILDQIFYFGPRLSFGKVFVRYFGYISESNLRTLFECMSSIEALLRKQQKLLEIFVFEIASQNEITFEP